MTHPFDRALMEGHDAGFDPVECEECGVETEGEDMRSTVYGERCATCCEKMRACKVCEQLCEITDMDNDQCPDCARLDVQQNEGGA